MRDLHDPLCNSIRQSGDAVDHNERIAYQGGLDCRRAAGYDAGLGMVKDGARIMRNCDAWRGFGQHRADMGDMFRSEGGRKRKQVFVSAIELSCGFDHLREVEADLLEAAARKQPCPLFGRVETVLGSKGIA